MSTIEKRFERRKLTDVHPYERNARRNDDAVYDVMESIKQCGELDPIEVDEAGIILSGHTRYKALKKLGHKEADVIVFTGLTEEQKRKYRLLANKTGERATWDKSLLIEELIDMDFGGYDFGFGGKAKAAADDGEVEFTEELMLTHNYIVLYFDNDFDWSVAMEKFGLKEVKDLIPRKAQPTGIGRVVDGKKVLEWQS